jgi:hypothetical protein
MEHINSFIDEQDENEILRLIIETKTESIIQKDIYNKMSRYYYKIHLYITIILQIISCLHTLFTYLNISIWYSISIGLINTLIITIFLNSLDLSGKCKNHRIIAKKWSNINVLCDVASIHNCKKIYHSICTLKADINNINDLFISDRVINNGNITPSNTPNNI